MARVFLYSRVSSGRQAVSGYGMARQEEPIEEIRRWCLAEGHVLADDDIMRDARLSAYTSENLEPTAALGKFLNSVSAGKIEEGSYLIVEELNWLFRQDELTATLLLGQLLKAGIVVKTWNDRKEYSAKSQTSGLDLIQAILNLSEAYKSSKLKSGYGVKLWGKKRQDASEFQENYDPDPSGMDRPDRWQVRRKS